MFILPLTRHKQAFILSLKRRLTNLALILYHFSSLLYTTSFSLSFHRVAVALRFRVPFSLPPVRKTVNPARAFGSANRTCRVKGKKFGEIRIWFQFYSTFMQRIILSFIIKHPLSDILYSPQDGARRTGFQTVIFQKLDIPNLGARAAGFLSCLHYQPKFVQCQL